MLAFSTSLVPCAMVGAGPAFGASEIIADGGSLNNTGAIVATSGQPAVYTSNGDSAASITNGLGATITGSKSAIVIGYDGNDVSTPNAGANLTTFINNGTITAAVESYASALKVGGNVTDFTNSGLMTASNYHAVLIFKDLLGTFENKLGATITSDADSTIFIKGAANKFINAGTIRNTSTDGDDAVVISKRVTELYNSGTIESSNGWGLWLTLGADTIVNSGTISGRVGIEVGNVADAAGMNVTNRGTITGTDGLAIKLTDYDDVLVLEPGSTISGIVDARGHSGGSSGGDTLTLGGATGTASFSAAAIGVQYLAFEKFSKSGASKWTLTGTSTLAADWTMDEGILAIADSIANMNFELSGGTLMGGGAVGNVSLANASIAPGNSIGVLTVNDIMFGTGSIYEVELSGTQADKIIVNGTATIDDLTVHATGTASTCGTLQLTILTAANPLNILHDPVLTGSSGGTLSWDSNNLYLDFTGSGGRTFSGYTNTANQEATARALDALGCNNQPYADALNALADEDVPAAMDALSGEGHAAIAAAMMENANAVSNAASTRLEQAFDKVGSVAPSGYAAVATLLDPGGLEGLDVWANGYGGLTQHAGNGNAAATQSLSSGLVFGADRKVSEDWIAGLLGGVGVTGITSGATTGVSLDATIGAYAGAELGVVKVKAGAAYTRHFIATSRAIVFPGVADTVRAAYQAGTAQGFIEFGTDIEADGTTLTPFAKIEGVSHATDAFTETGGAGALATAASLSNALFATLGIGAERQFVLNDTMLVTARGSLAWRHAVAGQVSVANSFAGGGPFTIASAGIAPDVLVVGAGASIDIDERTSLDASYEGSLGGGLAAHALRLTLSGRF